MLGRRLIRGDGPKGRKGPRGVRSALWSMFGTSVRRPWGFTDRCGGLNAYQAKGCVRVYVSLKSNCSMVMYNGNSLYIHIKHIYTQVIRSDKDSVHRYTYIYTYIYIYIYRRSKRDSVNCRIQHQGGRRLLHVRISYVCVCIYTYT